MQSIQSTLAHQSTALFSKALEAKKWVGGLCLGVGVLTMTGCLTLQPSLDDNTVSVGDEQAANDYQDRAVKFMDAGAYDAALAMFGLALEENPNLIQAHLGMTDVYKQQGNYDFMARAAARAVRSDPDGKTDDNFKAYYSLGFARQMLGKAEEAIGAYLRALTIKPDDFEANRDVASAYMQTNSVGQALTYAEKATQLNPEDAGAWANLGTIYNQLGKHEKAIQAYRTAADLSELSPPILLGLGDAYIRLKDYKLGENTLRQLTSLYPTATAHERLALCLFKQQRIEEAFTSYNQALALDPSDIAALNGAGACLMSQYLAGERRDKDLRNTALEHWQTSLKIQGDQPRIIELIYQFNRM